MGKVDVLKETTPLSSEDCFLVMQRPKSGFNFPLHVHMLTRTISVRVMGSLR